MEPVHPAIERIKRWRMAEGISQEEMAFACGYRSRSAYQKVEEGATRPNIQMLEAAANFMGQPLATLVDPENVTFQVQEQQPTYVNTEDSHRVAELEAENLQLYRRLSECQEKLLEHMTH